MNPSENELAVIRQELNELRQAFAAMRGKTNGTSLLEAAESSAATDRRGMLKKMAGMAVGIAAVGLLRPTSSNAATRISGRTPTATLRKNGSPQPDTTGDNWQVGTDEDADVFTGLFNSTTDQIDTQLRIRNYGLTDFVPPANTNIGVVGYVDTEFSTLSADGQVGGWFEARQTGATGHGIGVVGFAGNDARGVGGSFNGGDGGIVVTGGRVTLCLFATTEVFPPTSGIGHALGEIVVATDYSLWYSVIGGAPATWRRLASVETAGSLALLPVPSRIIDTRSGSGYFDAGNHFTDMDTRTYDIATLAGLPVGTTAVLGRATVMNNSGHSGGVQASPNGPVNPPADLGPGTAIVNFSASDTQIGDSFTSNLGGGTDLNVSGFVPAGGSFDVIIDVIGYYL